MTKAAMRLAAILAALCASLSSAQAQSLNIEVLSSRPELVSGGSALVQISGPSLDSLKVRLNGQSIPATNRKNWWMRAGVRTRRR